MLRLNRGSASTSSSSTRPIPEKTSGSISGPKGFTGRNTEGSTYWDTEAYCLPFYLSTAPQKVAKNLLVYRYDQLGKAIENAAKLGFDNGAALYPMVTMNGEECHNEWEITFEEIHRNGAIAFAIYDYIRHTLDAAYLIEGGLEVLTGIAFLVSAIPLQRAQEGLVMHGVTGPNEYENNINNNWYTNYIAAWCMRYAADCFDRCRQEDAKRTEDLSSRLNWSSEEGMQWRNGPIVSTYLRTKSTGSLSNTKASWIKN